MSELRKLKPEEYSEARKQAMQEMVVKTELPKIEPKKKAIEVIEKKEIKKIEEPDKKLIADIVKLYAKYYERARVETIMFYWELGKRVNDEYGKPRVESEESTRNSSKKGFTKLNDSYASLIKKLRELGIKIHPYDLRQARRFAVKQPHIEELIKQQDLTWNKIRRGLTQKKEIENKGTFNKEVFKYFKKWNNFVNDFTKAITTVNFSTADQEQKKQCINILKDSVKKIQKRIEELEK